MSLNQMKAVFLTTRQIRGLSILATAHLEELKLVNENPELIDIYASALGQLARAS
jgi:hypothetical protein